ncbi:MAG TPA: hypothetical protein VHN99_10770 [Deinococcales bacterium]|nr:hypothetical protein [Deinococcales bacterium]
MKTPNLPAYEVERDPHSITDWRADPNRAEGWTQENVIAGGLGVLERSRGGYHLIRLDGRSSGPVRFLLTQQEYRQWLQAQEDAVPVR